MPIANLASVLENGILSHERAERLKHRSVAMQEVQDRRDVKQVPQGLRLHQYANLYFDARNPMLSKRRSEAETLCVLAIARSVLKRPDVVITDQNAASDYVRFYHPTHWNMIDFNDVFDTDWRHPDDARRQYQHKSRKCAEVLVPHAVPPELLQGAYVVSETAAGAVRAIAPDLPIKIVPDMFFH